MGIFNNISKLSKSNIKTADSLIGLILPDYAKKEDLLNYHEKLKPIDMGGNKITSLGEPTEPNDAISRSFLQKRINAASTNIKNEINLSTRISIDELTLSYDNRVTDLETKIATARTALLETQKSINDQQKSITSIMTEINKKDTLSPEEIKEINNKLATELKTLETKMTELNKKYIDADELQGEINKLKDSILKTNTDKDAAEKALVKSDITSVKTFNHDIDTKINEIKRTIASIQSDVKEIKPKADRTTTIETNLNNAKTQLIEKDEELKRDITALQELINKDINLLNKKTDELNTIIVRIDNKDEELKRDITSVKTLLDNIDTKFTTKDEQIIRKIENVESTSVNTIQITNAANKTLIDEINKKINDLSIKVPFQFKVASIIATDQVEVVGTTTSDRTTTSYTPGRDGRIKHTKYDKDIYYDILSRVVHNQNTRSFKALGVYDKYFYVENDNILIPKVGLRFIKAGTYIIESNFKIKIIKSVSIRKLYLNYIHNKTNYYDDNIKEDIPYFDYKEVIHAEEVVRNRDVDPEYQWRYYIRFDIKSNDTLDIKLCVNSISVPYENIFTSFTNSSIEIYYINYLGLPIS